ncbi:MAG TPA: hypothetical protein VKB47_08930 [Terracidiphilus sp.]|nr:hypothetical protein [Terracidiphilus sp.]
MRERTESDVRQSKLNSLISALERAESDHYRYNSPAEQAADVARWKLAVANMLSFIERGMERAARR